MPRTPRRVAHAAALLLAACKAAPTAPPITGDDTATAAQRAAVPDGAPARPAAEARTERLLSQAISRLLEQEHLRRKPIDDAVSRDAFARYVKNLDPARSFLLQDDVDQLQLHADRIDDEIKAGDLALARLGAELQRKRLAFVQKTVSDLLAKPLNLQDDEALETDGEKRPWCRNEAELKERWRQILELQLLQRMARERDIDKAKAEAAASRGEPAPAPRAEDAIEQEARAKLARDFEARFKRMDQPDPTDATELLFNAVTQAYDPHTIFLPPARKENFDISMSGSLEGIGATLQEDESFIKVIAIVPGSPSWKQGQLEAGDHIIAVAQDKEEPVDVVGMRLRDVVRMIRGPKGTRVTLTVKKSDERVLNIPIVRDVVSIDETYAKGALLQHPGVPGKIGYVDLPSFYGGSKPDGSPDRHCTDDVRALLEAFQKQGADAVIIDLRGNSGGLLSDSQRMSGLFFDQGPVVQTLTADGRKEVLTDKDPRVDFKGRVVVLTDAFSASASEILAGALQDYKRAVIVGTPQTHGKGTVQQLLNLDRMVEPTSENQAVLPLGVLKLTRQQFFRVSGSSTQNRGVVPDIILPDPWAHIDALESDLDNAIPWSSTEPADFKPWTPTWDLDKLKAASQQRVAQSDAFQLVNRRSNLLKTRKDRTLEPLKADVWNAQRDQEQKQLDALTPEIEKQPARLSAALVDYDGSIAKRERLEAQSNADRKLQLDSDGDGEGDIKARKDGWKINLERDAYVEEAIFILRDMAKPR